MSITAFIMLVFVLPAVAAALLGHYKVAHGGKIAATLPCLCILLISTSYRLFDYLVNDDTLTFNVLGWDIVIYLLYGIPAGFLAWIIWYSFKPK